MTAELLLYAEVLVYLVGTLLYGFIARELVRRPAVLSGNRALRVLAASVTLWFGGCLADEVLVILAPDAPWYRTFGPWLDVGRGAAWLAVFPLFAHACWRFLRGRAALADRPPPSPLWLVPGYAGLALFAPPAVAHLRGGSTALADAVRACGPLVLVHLAVAAGVTLRLLLDAVRSSRDATLSRLLRSLALASVAVVVATAAGFVAFTPAWGEHPPAALFRVLAQGVGVVPGAVLLWFARRHSLLRLTVPLTSLRHFAVVVSLVVVVMAFGPALEPGAADTSRRLVAWGVVAALAGAVAYRPSAEWLRRRAPGLRRLLGGTPPPVELERLGADLRDPRRDAEGMWRLTADALRHWLRADVRLLDRDGPGAPLWAWFARGGTDACSRVDAPQELLETMFRLDLHAALPVRVGGELEGVLVVGPGLTGSPGGETEMDTVRLALSQLAGALELRRLVAARVEGELRLAEAERLGTLGLVTASLAHEIRNPLGAMKSLAQTVHGELEAGSDQAQDLATIVEQIDRLEAVAREILQLARPRPGDRTDLAALVRSSLYVLRPEARRRGITIEAKVEAVGPVPGSPATWQSVVFNLVLNAVRHAPDGATVEVLLAEGGGAVTLRTVNPGPPLSPEAGRRLLEPFASSDGTGLGLSMVTRAAERLGATLDVRAEGELVSFAFRAPMTEADDPCDHGGDGPDPGL